MMKPGRLWRGELPLGEAFWTYAVIGGIAVNAVTSLLFVVLVSADRLVAALLVGYALSVPYNVLAIVGVWRAAERDEGPRARAELYRIVALVGLTLLSVT
ncbi:MAG: hypothetical protein GEU92_16605 [Alphaproteobacteria bacterium]|nr:hypothetical protein [Alphaproteobacteria bacterium]